MFRVYAVCPMLVPYKQLSIRLRILVYLTCVSSYTPMCDNNFGMQTSITLTKHTNSTILWPFTFPKYVWLSKLKDFSFSVMLFLIGFALCWGVRSYIFFSTSFFSFFSFALAIIFCFVCLYDYVDVCTFAHDTSIPVYWLFRLL